MLMQFPVLALLGETFGVPWRKESRGFDAAQVVALASCSAMMARTMTVRAVNTSDIIDARGQMLRLITATAFILIYSAARAGGLPAYDTEAVCEDLAGTSAKQQLVMRGCLDFEERTKKEVALAWDGLPESVRAACDDFVKRAGLPSYYRLKTCIDREGKSSERPHPGGD
jgi:hypothetical protein